MALCPKEREQTTTALGGKQEIIRLIGCLPCWTVISKELGKQFRHKVNMDGLQQIKADSIYSCALTSPAQSQLLCNHSHLHLRPLHGTH